MDQKVQLHTTGCETAADIWTKLNIIYETGASNNKLAILMQFFDLHMEQNEKVENYIGKCQYMASQLHDANVQLDECIIVAKIVKGLPNLYANFKENWIDENPEKQTIDNLLPKLIAHESFIKNKANDNQALHAQTAKSTNQPHHQGKNNKFNSKNKQNRHQNIQQRKKNSTCKACGEEGHWGGDPECSKTEKQDKKQKIQLPIIAEQSLAEVMRPTNLSIESHIVELNQPIEANIAKADSAKALNLQHESEWIFDSDATDHMSNDSTLLIEYSKLDNPIKIQFGSEAFGFATGIGNLVVKSNLC